MLHVLFKSTTLYIPKMIRFRVFPILDAIISMLITRIHFGQPYWSVEALVWTEIVDLGRVH